MSEGLPAPWYKKLLWMLVIWSASVAALAVVALGLRFVINRGA